AKVRAQLESGQLDVIVQVGMLGEGADYPKLSVAAVFRPFRHVAPYVQFVGRVMRAIENEKPGHPSNRGYVVSHAGLNVGRWWAEVGEVDEDDQQILDELAKGNRGFLLPVDQPDDEPGERQRFAHDMQVVKETIDHFVEETLLPEDEAAVLDDLMRAMELR